MLLLSSGFLCCALSLAVVGSNRSGRLLLLASIIYVPSAFLLEILADK
jgi:hypothetical protein